MTSLLPARRQAERFDSLVERGLSAHDADLDAATLELLEVVGALRQSAPAAPRAEFVATLRERLMAVAEVELTPVSPADVVRDRLTVAPRRTPKERRLAIALGGFAVVGATTSMAVAAQSALPGDALYPLKRAIENVQAGMSTSDHAKGRTLLSDARGRLDEVHDVTTGQGGDSSDIASTLNTFSDQATEASGLLLADYHHNGNVSSINALHAFTAQSIKTLTALEGVVPAQAHDALIHAAEVVLGIDQQASQACPGCGAPGIASVPPELMSAGGAAGAAFDHDQAILSLGQIDAIHRGDGPGTATSHQGTGQPVKGHHGQPGGQPSDGSTAGASVGGSSASAGSTNPIDPITSAINSALGNHSGQGNQGGGKGGQGGGKDTTSLPSAVQSAVDGVVSGVGDALGGLP